MPQTQPAKQQRKPRYRRASKVAFRLQGRDVEIIKQVYRHRFLSSEHIISLLGESRRGILRRLHLLYHGGYLDRPREQVKPQTKGNAPTVYGLGNKGAALLTETADIPRGKVDWTSKNREVKTIFLEHTLAAANVMVCLELACRRKKNIKIIRSAQIISQSPPSTQKQLNPLSVKVRTKAGDSFSVIPDKVFGLHFTDEPAGQNKAYFFLEADRGTMPIKRNNLFKTSFYKKLLGYWTAWNNNLFKKTFGFKNVRVLTITTSQDRIDNIIRAGKESEEIRGKGKGSRMFLFTTAKNIHLEDPENVLKPIWKDGQDGQQASLLD